MVAEPGNSTYATGLDTNRVRLITDYGDHYVMPRFQINSTDSQMIFLSANDYLEVGSFITFRVSSTGVFSSKQRTSIVNQMEDKLFILINLTTFNGVPMEMIYLL